VEDCHAVESKERRSQIRLDAAHARLVCSLGRGKQGPQDAFGKLAAARHGAADRRVVQRVLPKRLDSRGCRALRLSVEHAGNPDHFGDLLAAIDVRRIAMGMAEPRLRGRRAELRGDLVGGSVANLVRIPA
jgi:hypothetical protein